ncbi:MAG: glutamate synthase subunit beta [Nitrospirota bacterium]|nr:glutamate synthase subunit beta [Nitrospirota bacterium]
MGKITGFMEYNRELPEKRPVDERVKDHKELYKELPAEKLKNQAARCMDCGVPFCHNGCPLGNVIPFWNDLVYQERWKEACEVLHSTNNFPEFTSRVCPSPCEASCVLNLGSQPVTIRQIEYTIVERGFKEGWITPQPAAKKTGKQVAVIGSGPSGMAAAQQLARAGHAVTLFERDNRMGGILTYGIPDFKLEKWVVQRRLDQMAAEGVTLKAGVNVGVDITVDQLRKDFDAICLTGGSTQPRDLPVPGRELKGVYFAMEALVQQNRLNFGDAISPEDVITAKGKKVIILGGGDTGADCVGTSVRQGAASIHQYEIMPKAPEQRTQDNPWPQWPNTFRSSTSHEEGGIRDYCIMTKSFSGKDGKLEKIHAIRVEWVVGADGRMQMREVAGSEFEQDADLVLLAMGFVHPEHNALVKGLGMELDSRGNIKVDGNGMTSVPGVFAAGDMARGQSLVVKAIADARAAAAGIDRWLETK